VQAGQECRSSNLATRLESPVPLSKQLCGNRIRVAQGFFRIFLRSSRTGSLAAPLALFLAPEESLPEAALAHALEIRQNVPRRT
jgi:hypothetical protein